MSAIADRTAQLAAARTAIKQAMDAKDAEIAALKAQVESGTAELARMGEALAAARAEAADPNELSALDTEIQGLAALGAAPSTSGQAQ
jgi:predicted  nucleic acid-binding Zn-ribbon protein